MLTQAEQQVGVDEDRKPAKEVGDVLRECRGKGKPTPQVNQHTFYASQNKYQSGFVKCAE